VGLFERHHTVDEHRDLDGGEFRRRQLRQARVRVHEAAERLRAGFGAPRPGDAGGGAGHARQKDFGPPAPPKDKKKPFKKNEDKPRGPIPTKFTGRTFDLDDTDEDDDAIDITPDFMKHEDPEVEAPDAAADAAVDDTKEAEE
jgi:hypothetical protein